MEKDVRLVLVAEINTFAGRVPYGEWKRWSWEMVRDGGLGEAGPFCRWTRPGTDSAGKLCCASLSDKYRGTSPANENARQSVLGGAGLWARATPLPTSRVFEGGAFPLRESQHKPHHNISKTGNFWGFAPRTRSQSRGGLRDFLPQGIQGCNATRFMMELPSHKGSSDASRRDLGINW